MILPELALQGVYGRLAWAAVIATVAIATLPGTREMTRLKVLQLLCFTTVLTLLPGQLSPAYWIALAFQWPSGLLIGLCLVRLVRPWRESAAKEEMPLALSASLFLFGLVLYADALGLLPLGLYFWGFGTRGAPFLALAAMALCVAGIVHGRTRPQYFAALGALTLFTLLRLPTGNLWDAVLDPLLWIWAAVSLGRRAWRKWERISASNNIKQGVGQW